jgi:hypothetical protein
MKYRKALLAFIDILGFRNLVQNDRKGIGEPLLAILNLHKMNNIDYTELINKITTHNEQNKCAELLSIMFSDSIVRMRYLDDQVDNNATIRREILSLMSMQNSLFIEWGILIRGGLTIGDIYYDKPDSVLFGSAMNRAYHLENTLALYPRIILDPNLDWSNFITFSANDDIQKDDKDTYYIDYLRQKDALYQLSLPQCSGDSAFGLRGKSSVEFYLEVERVIKDLLRNYKNDIPDNRVIEKHNWIIDNYNVVVDKIDEWVKLNSYNGKTPSRIDRIPLVQKA